MTGNIKENSSLGQLVRELESAYTSGKTTISKYVQFDMHDTIEKIEAYLNSKHTSGDKDSLGRDKPFFNIVTASANIWYRATDIDRKNIRIKATKSKEVIPAFLATIFVQEWMRKSNFGQFLNEWGRVLARYGSAVCKFIEKDGELKAEVVPWNRLIVDPIDFNANVKIEVLELSESQLRNRKGYDQKVVESLCKASSNRETLDGQAKDNRDYYIKLYEVHGELPLSHITGNDEDDDKYEQQMHVFSFIKGEDGYEDYTLYSGREEKDPYMITHLIKEDGRTLSIGAVEHLFESQWMTNHSMKAIKDQLDLASKLIFQTSDGKFVGQNALTAIENGDILIHAVNQPLTQVNNNSHDTVQWSNYMIQWKSLGDQIVGVSESMRGESAPSGTAWRQVEALLQESHSLFELMTENKGLDIEQMFKVHVIPHVKKKFDTADEISAILEANDIAKIDSLYLKNYSTKVVNQAIKDRFSNNKPVFREEQSQMMTDMQSQLSQGLQSFGNQRFFKPSDVPTKTWKEVFNNIEDNVVVDVTGENSVTKEDMATLTTVFQTIADPVKRQVLSTPEGKALFNKILNATAIVSPLEISDMPSSQPANAPNGGVVGAGVGALTATA